MAESLTCPRCVARANDASLGPYRGSGRPDGTSQDPLPLVESTHEASGAIVHTCRACGGQFVSYEGMLALEAARSKRITSGELARVAYERPKTPVRCARCGGETTRRKWGVHGIVVVDVCDDYDCRGVWLDEGEVERLSGTP